MGGLPELLLWVMSWLAFDVSGGVAVVGIRGGILAGIVVGTLLWSMESSRVEDRPRMASGGPRMGLGLRGWFPVVRELPQSCP